jgi:undecaprenyl-diphosphatase
MNVDLYLFNLINGYAKKSRLLDFFGIFFARFLGYLMILWLLYFSYVSQNIRAFLFPMLSGLISIIVINEIVYAFYKRKRPMEVIFDKTLIKKPISPAFPSSHTSFFLALSFGLFFFNPSLAVIFIMLSLCISLARVFCGVHWPSDIIGGVISAGLSFFIVYIIRIII